MKLIEIGSFTLSHEGLAWPWIAFSRDAVAWVHGDRFETRSLEKSGPSFPCPVTLDALRGFALHPNGERLAYCANGDVVSCDAGGERLRTTLPEGFGPMGVCFDRKGGHLWIVGETPTETVFRLLDAESHAFLGESRSAALPRPTTFELYPHPVDDAVLLVAACGEDGTFARVVGWSGSVQRIETELDAGAVSAGFVGFSTDGARVHLAEADELRTHAWPTLHELSSVPLADDFVSSFSGVVMGDAIWVDGQSADDGDDLVMRFDKSAIRGGVERPPYPEGMWCGRLGDCVVTLDPKTGVAKILRLEPPKLVS